MIDKPCRFSTIFDTEDIFYDFLFAFLYINPLLKGSTLKKEDFVPKREIYPNVSKYYTCIQYLGFPL